MLERIHKDEEVVMAGQEGRELILKVLEDLTEFQKRFDSMDRTLSVQTDSVLLFAETVQWFTSAMKERVEDHERRLVVLERSGH
jgi:hypothetical protein